MPLRFDMMDITAEHMAAEMTRDAVSIQIMRAASRVQTPADRLYSEYVGTIFEYRLEPVETLKGRPLGMMSLTAPDAGWLQAFLPGAPRHEHQPLWWLTSEGYERLQHTSIYLPNDFYSTTCAGPVVFEIGQSYLVFRGADGGLLAPGFTPHRVDRLQRPALERLHGSADPWLVAVRAALPKKDLR